ncbi:MAG: hypothetical protein ABR601_11080 [Parasphingopyxis sp.]|nr:hypothetical protein [Sphingomonadales bacterium]
MHKRRYEAAERVATRLFEAETAIDEAITRVAQLTAILPQARQDARLSAVVGQEALESAVAILPALAQARQQIVNTHAKLDGVKGQVGLGPVSFGGSGGKPPEQTGLHAVEDVA